MAVTVVITFESGTKCALSSPLNANTHVTVADVLGATKVSCAPVVTPPGKVSTLLGRSEPPFEHVIVRVRPP